MERTKDRDYDPLAAVQAAGPPGTISFIYGLPDPDTFPVQELQGAFGEVLRERSALALQYGPEQGYGPLISLLSFPDPTTSRITHTKSSYSLRLFL